MRFATLASAAIAAVAMAAESDIDNLNQLQSTVLDPQIDGIEDSSDAAEKIEDQPLEIDPDQLEEEQQARERRQ